MLIKLNLLFVLLGSLISQGICQTYTADDIRQVFVQQLIKSFGNGSAITIEDIQVFYKSRSWKWPTTSSVSECFAQNSSTLNLENCIIGQCVLPKDVYQLSGLSNAVTDSEVSTLSAILLYLSHSKDCSGTENKETSTYGQEKPLTAEVWGYGFLCTTVIVISAVAGFVAIPCIHGIAYKKTLIFMVGLAVGTLTGSSLLFLLPEALELTEQDLNENSYVWKCLVVVTAVYVFFNIERILKLYTVRRERIRRKKNMHSAIHGGRFASLMQNSKFDSPKSSENGKRETIERKDSAIGDSDVDIHTVDSTVSYTVSSLTLGEQSDTKPEHDHHIAPVAWMIVFGDALHNLIDGVSIGAAFTQSVIGGLSVSLAIECEELPHELGDLAVLLAGGMTKKRALFYNLLSACTIYIGLIIGIFLGENMSTHTWVFAFAAGMFLYIALVDMMPEMSAASELEENKISIGTRQIYLLQNLGILAGFGVILILAIFGGDIEEAIQTRS